MTETQDQPKRRTYRGSCHCGAFIYEIDLPEVKTVVDCDCSFCSRKGNLYVLTNEDDNFRTVKGSEEKLTSYTFGPGSKIHKARAIQDVDISSLGRRNIFNSKISPRYLPPEHMGDIPPGVEGGQLYTGSCHCGAVTVALSCKPLDESSEERILECNCSICQRNAYVWLLPKPENVVLSGSEDAIGRYVLADGLTSKAFCRTCGVNMTSLRNPLPEKEVLALSEHARQVYWRGRAYSPVNARTLHGVDVGKLKTILYESTAAISCRLHM
ncbi:hypothetical protein ACHAQJ_000136 [Trichoderma viride]